MDFFSLLFFGAFVIFVIGKVKKQVRRYGGVARGSWAAGRKIRDVRSRVRHAARDQSSSLLDQLREYADDHKGAVKEEIEELTTRADTVRDVLFPQAEEAPTAYEIFPPEKDLPVQEPVHEPIHEPEPEPAEEPVVAAEEPAAATPPPLDPHLPDAPPPRELATALFDSGRTGLDAVAQFDLQHRGSRAHWSGTVEHVDVLRNDEHLGPGPGVRLTLEVPPPEGSYSRSVRVVCGMPEGARPRVGERGDVVEVEGRLVACDPYLWSFFLVDAQLKIDLSRDTAG